MAKQETIKHLTDLMGVIQNAYYKKGMFTPLEYDSNSKMRGDLRVHEDNKGSISIDLYNFEGDGLPVCDGLKPCTVTLGDGSTDIGWLFCMCYNPDEATPLVFLFTPDEELGNNDGDIDLVPENLPEEVLKNITAWLEKAMVSAKQETKPNPKQMKALMDRWAGFCYSHPPYDEVILWMVGGSKQHYLYQHFCSKFLHLCSVCHEDTMFAWIEFYRELDDQWAERLMEYVYCEWENENDNEK